MRDTDQLEGIATRILKRLPKKWQASLLVDQGMDIEKLISLLAASNVAEHSKLADAIRKLYFEEICQSLAAAKVLTNPQLAVGLLTMHGNEHFRKHETLSGIITTNHDGLLQVAAQKVHTEVNIGIPFRSQDLTPSTTATAPVLHLHGSFTWRFGLPVKVTFLSETSAYAGDTVWIPPTILKESRAYPFNKLAGLAYELLSNQCDVLRVVGSALTQNDWNVLSMIFNAQRHREITEGAPFRVELIMPHGVGMAIAKECSYLENLTPIGFLTEGDDLAAYKEADGGAPLTSEMNNPLAFWIKQKIQFHKNRGDLGDRPLEGPLAQIAGENP